jgi:hypothetical protein
MIITRTDIHPNVKIVKVSMFSRYLFFIVFNISNITVKILELA